MKRPRDFAILLMMALILTLSCCVSCKTAEPEVITVTEYIPMTVDIRPEVKVLFDARPNDAEQMKLIPKENVDNSIKLLWNSWEYQCAWERWSDYAIGLEDYLENLAESLANENV